MSARLVSARPTAFGGWQFVLETPAVKVLHWFPGDRYLMDSESGREFLGAPVAQRGKTAARKAADALVSALNAAEQQGEG